ncbi:MAG: (d)CMP kinase [Synergistaceae bacterium]|nr:(d)CMP kinase [Synergistaceae bacterium]
MTEPLIIAIDGPAGSGKSTVARRVAAALGIAYLDTGAIYRAIALALSQAGIPPVEKDELRKALAGLSVEITSGGLKVNGREAGIEIRSPFADSIVSPYAALPSVREALLTVQREQGERTSLVADGRDMGTVVFPGAAVKIFLTASDHVRAERRRLELQARGDASTFGEVLERIRERDRIDSTRETAPLRMADDAVEVDTDGLSIDEVERAVLVHIAKKLQDKG